MSTDATRLWKAYSSMTEKLKISIVHPKISNPSGESQFLANKVKIGGTVQ
jgi:hypothetical protein